MSACPQCGTVAKPTDKFCNTCGTRLPAAAEPPPAAPPQAYAPPPQAAPQGYGGPQPGGPMGPGPGAPPGMAQQQGARCQMGHDIAPGASYCAQGHPIALAGMQFAPQDQYAQAGSYGQPQAPQAPPPMPQPGGQPFGGQGGFGGYSAAPQPSASPIGGAPGAFGDPNAQYGGAYGQPPMNPNAQYGAPGGFAQQPQAPQYAPAPFGQPQQPVFNAPAQPPQAQQPSPQAFGAQVATSPDASKALRGFLVAYQAVTSGEFWPLAGGRVVIGRAGSGENVDVPLADPTISSKHAVLNVDGVAGTIAVEDTGSTNGTFVNEEHIGFNGRRDLKDGDRVRFGGFTTVVKVIGRI